MLDQAIAFWHRVEKAWPGDEKIKQSISMLVVQRASSLGDLQPTDAISGNRHERARQIEKTSLETRLLQRIEEEPEKLDHYLELSQLHLNEQRYRECEELLARAYEISGRDPDIREKWEDARLRHLRQQIAQCEEPVAQKALKAQYFAEETEVWKNRVARYPSNLAFRYELGHRYLLTKRYGDAIGELQVAKADPGKRGLCLLALGQCFQQIKQYRLANSHYESAIKETPERDADNRKRALYLAGRLALALNDVDAAQSHLSALAGVDFGYRDVALLLDKIAELRQTPQSAGIEGIS